MLQTSVKSKSIHFPNLDALRFIAALMVFTCHTEGVKSNYNLPYNSSFFYFLIGKLGVVLFFVLSGFLITYLLLTEEIQTGFINVPKFYFKRILRIWPLYFLIIFFSIFVAPNLLFFYQPHVVSSLQTNSVFLQFITHLLLFPNLSIALFGVIPYAGQLWSIGVEEQFYLFWPILIKRVKNRLVLFVGVFIMFSAVKLLLVLLAKYFTIAVLALSFWYYFNIDLMAIGALAAYLVVYKKEKILNVIYSKWMQVIVWAIVIILITNSYQFKVLHYEIYGVFFAIIILNLACNKNNLVKLDNKMINFLGKISYGIYMFHYIALAITIKILSALNYTKGFEIYLMALLLTVGLSALSYYFFEGYFLKWKDRVSKETSVITL